MREARAVLAVAAIGIVTLTAGLLVTSTDRAFTIGVLSGAPSPGIAPGQTACQQPITVPPGGGFDTVEFQIGNYFQRAGPAVDVTVRPLVVGAFPLRRGTLGAGYPDVGVEQRQRVRVGDVPEGVTVAVCFRNRGPGNVALFGDSDVAARESSASIGGREFGFDFDLVFRDEERSFASRLPDVVRRASLFRPPWLPPGAYYVMLAVLIIGVPLLLARATGGLGAAGPPAAGEGSTGYP